MQEFFCFLFSDLDTEFETIVENLGKHWRKFVRTLGLSDPDMDYIIEEHRGNTREQIWRCLKLWQSKNQSAANKNTLIAALRKCGYNMIADKLNKM